MLIKRREDTANDMKKQREKADRRLEVIKVQDAEWKEKEVKLKEKESELQEKLEDPPEKTVIQVTPDPEVEKVQKRDAKANALRKLALKLQAQGNRKVRAGQTFLRRADKDVQKQRNATKMAEITTNVTIVQNGKQVTVEPDVHGELAKAGEEAPLIANSLETAVNLVKAGQDDLNKAKEVLKEAVAMSKDKPAPVPAKKPLALVPTKNGIPINPARIAQLRKELDETVEKMKQAPPNERPLLVETIGKLKEEINKQYNPLPKPIAEPKDLDDMSGGGRKAVEAGLPSKGKPMDAEKMKEKEKEKEAEQASDDKNTNSKKDKEEIKRAEEAVKTAMTQKPVKPGGGRGHSAWKPKKMGHGGKGKIGWRNNRGKGKRRGGSKRNPWLPGPRSSSKKPKLEAQYGVYAKSSEGSEVQLKLGDSVDRVHRALASVDKYVTLDHDGCDYQPPAGCGCDGTMMTQQSEPNNLLGESAEQVHLDAENEDPTSTNDCPKMPADCACRNGAAGISLVQIIDENDATNLDDDDVEDDIGDALDSMFDGIICRVRAAMAVAKSSKPSLITKMEHESAFVKHKDELAPLMSCVQDAKKTNSQCSQYLPALMGSMEEVSPIIKDMQQKLGLKYQRAVKGSCT